MKEFREAVCAAAGVLGGFTAAAFGGWNAALTTLCVFMAIDYITGLIVAGIFRSSPKTATGALESRAGLKGLLRKGMMLTVVLVAARLDMAVGTTVIKDGTVIAFITNETISIIENAGLMGIPVPAAVADAIDILRKKNGKDGK